MYLRALQCQVASLSLAPSTSCLQGPAHCCCTSYVHLYLLYCPALEQDTYGEVPQTNPQGRQQTWMYVTFLPQSTDWDCGSGLLQCPLHCNLVHTQLQAGATQQERMH